ncbi:Ran-binding protein 9 [Liparis tanakae]|uniref:Ran-binding protein 9 n=1 Tax=Liparis tanakae TaxID=230148 RepID=A0A4Z2FDL4_9TELE|nr:Ran-binding protein 9 [Liparis tanakae]
MSTRRPVSLESEETKSLSHNNRPLSGSTGFLVESQTFMFLPSREITPLPNSLLSNLPPLQPNLYPTVGLQTPGEVVDANFGQHPFVFDIEDYMREWRTKIQAQIDRFPIGEREGEWQSMIQK